MPLVSHRTRRRCARGAGRVNTRYHTLLEEGFVPQARVMGWPTASNCTAPVHQRPQFYDGSRRSQQGRFRPLFHLLLGAVCWCMRRTDRFYTAGLGWPAHRPPPRRNKGCRRLHYPIIGRPDTGLTLTTSVIAESGRDPSGFPYNSVELAAGIYRGPGTTVGKAEYVDNTLRNLFLVVATGV